MASYTVYILRFLVQRLPVYRTTFSKLFSELIQIACVPQPPSRKMAHGLGEKD